MEENQFSLVLISTNIYYIIILLNKRSDFYK